jgi:hypothetical protein
MATVGAGFSWAHVVPAMQQNTTASNANLSLTVVFIVPPREIEDYGVEACADNREVEAIASQFIQDAFRTQPVSSSLETLHLHEDNLCHQLRA